MSCNTHRYARIKLQDLYIRMNIHNLDMKDQMDLKNTAYVRLICGFVTGAVSHETVPGIYSLYKPMFLLNR